jgi:alkanesulfonate monooxygenase SsuD/methylene tetrahydromethanopterin reductase-like flavin-dependent oxidoreductase (luciferase family)
VECWQPIQGGTQRALDFMAKHRIKGIIGGGVAEGGVMDKTMEDFQAAVQRTGRDAQLGEDLSVGFHFFLADSQEQGIKDAAKFYEENVKMFGPLRLHRGLTDEQLAEISDPRRAPFAANLPTMEQAVESGAVLCGPPERVIEQLQQVQERYPGLERIGVSHPVGTPGNIILEQLEWFAKDVMPAFKGKVESAVPAD